MRPMLTVKETGFYSSMEDYHCQIYLGNVSDIYSINLCMAQNFDGWCCPYGLCWRHCGSVLVIEDYLVDQFQTFY